MDWSYIIAPLVGGVIGYVTNALAIKMLFRPHTPKYLFGKKLPFTPGIIPKEKGRIAKAIGGAISENLMSREVLEKNLLSDEMTLRIRTSIEDFFNEQKQNDETLHEFLLHYLSEEDVGNAVGSIKSELTAQMSSRMSDSDLGNQIAEVAAKHVTDKLRSDGLDLNIPGILARLIGPKLWNKLADLIEIPVRKFLAKNINQLMTKNGQEMIGNLITKEVDAFEKTPMRKLLEGKDAQIEQFTQSAMSFYNTIISEHLPRILSAVDIPKIVEGRINEMSMDETEKLIFELMDKELKAIIWLGALLGTIMGCVNLLI
jgi:uncharacterized membrane protein YheB (UPF0754 family)